VVAAPAPAPSAFQIAATSPTRPQDAQHAAEDSFDSILMEICQSMADHQQQLHQSFSISASDKTKQRRAFETRQSSFLDDIEAKL
jgi:hypothetical protein